MAELTDWQWALAAAVVIASLVLGGWLNRQRATPPEGLPEASAPSSNNSAELQSLRDELKARENELAGLREQLTDAREEAELTLLQLHQVQEELEHYFLESRDLQQQLETLQEEHKRSLVELRQTHDAMKAMSSIAPDHLEQLKRIKERLIQLLIAMPSASGSEARLRALVEQQQNVLRRFQRLHALAIQR